MTHAEYCHCGSTFRVSSTDPCTVADVAAAWPTFHAGDGHGPATPQQARRARVLQEQTEAAAS